jgi:hypothetical protein
MEKVSDVVGEVINELTSIEKKRLYDLNTQYDLINLEDHEKELLLACLYTLAGNNANENQKTYVRSVQKYLGIKNPQTSIGLSGIENIENLSSQKAMFQTFSEFLFLAKEDYSFVEENEDFFDHFSVSKKDRSSLLNNVVQIFNATGGDGLCEKYGFIAEADLKAFKEGAINIEKLQIKNEINIPEGEEKIFYGQEMRLSADIDCEGSLIFDHCVIIYNGDNFTGKIALGNYEASLKITHCTIVGKNDKTPAESNYDSFITGYGSKLFIDNTLFYNCRNFASVTAEADIQNCRIQYTKHQNTLEFLRIDGNKKARMQNCIIENLDPNQNPEKYGYDYLFSGIGNIISCTFKNILRPIRISEEGFTLTASSFHQCVEVISSNNAKIRYCLFEDCEQIFNGTHCKLDLKYSQFIGCKNKIVDSCSEAEIAHCEFFNYRADFRGYDSNCFSFTDYSKNNLKTISDCLFDGMFFNDNASFISCTTDKKRLNGVTIKKCKFLNCVKEKSALHVLQESIGGILNRNRVEFINQNSTTYGLFGSTNEIKTIDIIDCTGLDLVNKQGDTSSNIAIRHETPTDELIGVNLNEVRTGLSGIEIEKI